MILLNIFSRALCSRNLGELFAIDSCINELLYNCREPDQWSPEFIDFVSQCLVKNPSERATAEFLLTHEFIGM